MSYSLEDSKYNAKYIRHLAESYLWHYDTYGFESAKGWFENFLDEELRVLIRPYITELVAERDGGDTK